MIITIPGVPISQARMKATTRGGFARMYDPKAREKEEIRKQLLCFKSDAVFLYPRISFVFFMPFPKVSKKKHGLYASETLKHINRPDIDNLIKLYLDCLSGIILTDDKAVSLGMAIKVYSSTPRTVILLEETTPQLASPASLDASRDGICHS